MAASDPDAPVVAVVGVRHAYGTRVVLNDLTLSIGRGEALALVGRSGGGKSTLVKLIYRVLLPDPGTVLVDGRETRLRDPSVLRRRTG